MDCANVTSNSQHAFTLTNDLDSLLKKSIERFKVIGMTPEMTSKGPSGVLVYRSLAIPFVSELVCSVTREECSVEDFFI